MKQNQLISFLQVFGIVLVVLGHSFGDANSATLQSVPMARALYNWILLLSAKLF